MKVNSRTESFYYELKQGLNSYLNLLKRKEIETSENKTNLYAWLEKQLILNERKDLYFVELKDIFLINKYIGCLLDNNSNKNDDIVSEDIDILYYMNNILVSAIENYLEEYFKDIEVDFPTEIFVEPKESQIEIRTTSSIVYPGKKVQGLYIYIDGIIGTDIELILSEETCTNKTLLEEELYNLTKKINFYRLNNIYFTCTSSDKSDDFNSIADRLLASTDNL